ncbi:MAG TPA: hypothetical protein VKH13_11035 [Steroidobacteraceae bacterium]|nr:hypothetical protein [Steroidobacteraceae bacterium]
MQNNSASHFDAISNRLQRNPVLTAMIVTSLIIGVTASIAAVAAWRASSACIAPTSDDAPRSDLLMHQALQADLVGVAACPCAASIGWHWQRI